MFLFYFSYIDHYKLEKHAIQYILSSQSDSKRFSTFLITDHHLYWIKLICSLVCKFFNISIHFRHSFSLHLHVKIQSNTWRFSTWLILRQLCYQHQHLTFLSAFLHHNFFCYVCLTKSQYYYTIKEFCCHYFLANWYKHFLKAFCGNTGYSCDKNWLNESDRIMQT